MNDAIDKIINSVIEREKGYVNNPRDLGGETNWGITIKTARRLGYQGAMIDLRRDQAFDMLCNEYFISPGFDKVFMLSPAVAETLTDCGTLCGTQRASLWLQIALNALNRRQTLYSDIAEDGSIGNKTLEALRAFLDYRTKEGEIVLLRAITCQIGYHFISISRSREDNEEFVYGWLRHRVEIL